MVQLQGSEKQIKWAEDIRAQNIPFAENLREQFANAPTEQARKQAEDAMNAVLNEPSAHWWIEHRTDTFKQMMIAKMKGQ